MEYLKKKQNFTGALDIANQVCDDYFQKASFSLVN